MMNLKENERVDYLTVAMMHYEGDDSVKMSCPHCDYFELWCKENSANFFYCRNPKCEKGICSICINDICRGEDRYEEERKGMYKEVVGTHEKHFDCFEFRGFRRKWDEAIENGQTMKCPGCGNRG